MTKFAFEHCNCLAHFFFLFRAAAEMFAVLFFQGAQFLNELFILKVKETEEVAGLFYFCLM